VGKALGFGRGGVSVSARDEEARAAGMGKCG
jgi:hypothetical protein